MTQISGNLSQKYDIIFRRTEMLTFANIKKLISKLKEKNKKNNLYRKYSRGSSF